MDLMKGGIMIDQETDIIDSFYDVQTRFTAANDEGLDLGRCGGEYADPFDAIPGICRDKKNKMDRFVAFHYDWGYLTAYSDYLKRNPGAVEDLGFRRLKKKYELVDKAQKMGIKAYQEGRSSDEVCQEVYELLSGERSEISLSLYDGWEFGFLLGMMYDKDFESTGVLQEFDFERADALLGEDWDAECPDEGGHKVPRDVRASYANAKDILAASEDDCLLKCLTCPYHYGFNTGEGCDRDCYESEVAIKMMIGVEDEIIRGWMMHTKTRNGFI